MIEPVVLQSTFEWVAIGALTTIVVAVGTAMGALIKIAYDASQELGVTLYGNDQNGEKGFIQESRERHAEMEDSHHRMYEQMLIQGRLLSELSYSFASIAEELEDSEDIDVNVNLERIEKLRDRKENDRWDEDSQDDL